MWGADLDELFDGVLTLCPLLSGRDSQLVKAARVRRRDHLAVVERYLLKLGDADRPGAILAKPGPACDVPRRTGS